MALNLWQSDQLWSSHGQTLPYRLGKGCRLFAKYHLPSWPQLATQGILFLRGTAESSGPYP
jgi:hypothetical protein